MTRTKSNRSILCSLIKLCTMSLLFASIWNHGRAALTTHGIIEGFWPMMALVLSVIGMNCGAALSLRLFSDIKLPEWLKSVLTFVIILIASRLITSAMLWVYRLLFQILGAFLGIALCLLILFAAACGVGSALTAMCIVLSPQTVVYKNAYGQDVSKTDAALHILSGGKVDNNEF